MASGPITSWQIDGETVETVIDFILWGLKLILQFSNILYSEKRRVKKLAKAQHSEN